MYFTPDIIIRMIRWALHVVRAEDMRTAYKILIGKIRGRDHSEDLVLNGKTILKWTLGELG